MNYLDGYQGQFGFLDPLTLLAVGTTAIGIYQLIKPNEQEPGTKYVRSGIPLRTRTRIPPDGRLTWVTPEDMDYIIISIVDGADTLLRKIQIFTISQLKKSTSSAAANVYPWDMRYIGWKGEGKGKWIKADPSRGDYYYYVDGEVKQVAQVEQETGALSNQAQEAARLALLAAEQGNLELAAKYMEMAAQLAKQTEDTSQKAGSKEAAEAAEAAKAAAAQAQAMLEELKKMLATQAEGKMPSWIWIAVAAGALLLFMKR